MNIYKNSFIRKEFLKNNLKMFRSNKLFSDENTLIKKWKDHNRCSSFIDYEKLQVDIHLPEDTLNFNFSKFIDENRKHNYFEFRGRILFCRDLRNVIFGKIEVDVNKFIQFMVLKNESINSNDIKEIKTGNIVNIKGIKIKTKKETFAVMIDDLKIISKTEQHFPKPIQNQGLKSYDSRYNKRYLDLIINSENKEKLVKRSKIINQIRKFLIDLDFVEVETPILTQSKSGANAKTFDTHHDALKKDLHLRIAPEIYLKNLIISGFDRVFEIGKNFRNEDISVKHNPEFTSCELYATYWNYNDLFKFTLDFLQEMFRIFEFEKIESHHEIDCIKEFERILNRSLENISDLQFVEFIMEYFHKEKENLEYFKNLNMKSKDIHLQIIDSIIENQIEPSDILLTDKYKPIFIKHHPVAISPLAKRHPKYPAFVERFEVFVNNMEIINAYSELNDWKDQEIRMTPVDSNKKIMESDKEFIEALSYGMPPTAGWGLGIDRLIMILLRETNIKEIIAFPLMNKKV